MKTTAELILVLLLIPCVVLRAQDHRESQEPQKSQDSLVSSPEVKLVPHPDDPASWKQRVEEERLRPEIASRVEIYPNTIYFGDTVYFVAFERNLTEKPIEMRTRESYGVREDPVDRYMSEFSASITFQDLSYSVKPEYPPAFLLHGSACYGAPICPVVAQPDEEFIACRSFFDFPTLYRMNEPFWQIILQELETKEYVKVTLHIRFQRWIAGRLVPDLAMVETPITIKKRPDAEMKLFYKWNDNRLSGKEGHSFTLEEKDDGVVDYSVEIKDERYDPRRFERVGNFKPSPPNNPTTIEAWKALEESLIEGATRDEMTLVRLQFEYYACATDEEYDAATIKLLEWLDSRPVPQRYVYVSSILAQCYNFDGSNLKAPYERLSERIKEHYHVPKPREVDPEIEELIKEMRKRH